MNRSVCNLLVCGVLIVGGMNSGGGVHTPADKVKSAQAAEAEVYGRKQVAEALPVIDEETNGAILRGDWWDDNPTMLVNPSDDTPQVEALMLPISLDERSVLNPVPKNDEIVDEYFLPYYIKPAAGLSDPQAILSEMEQDDIKALIASLKKEFKYDCYVSVFKNKQEVPASINAPSLARQIFTPKHKSVLIHYHEGDVASIQVVFDDATTTLMDDTRRRAIVSLVKRDTNVYSHPSDMIACALISAIEHAEYLRAEGKVRTDGMPTTRLKDLDSSLVAIPDVAIEIPEKDSKVGLIKKLLVWCGEHLGSGSYVILGSLLLLVVALTVLIWWRRCKRKVLLMPSCVERRLGAKNGAGFSRFISYKGKN